MFLVNRNKVNPLDAMFDSFWKSYNDDSSLSTWKPKTDIKETENSYSLSLDFPGIDPKDVKVNLEGNLLTISGERKFEDEKEDETYHRIEKSYGKFVRQFNLPKDIDSSKIDADFKNGLLNITITKSEESKPKQIEVKIK